jgi:hypothetical protein
VANGAIQLERTKGELAQYYGATMFNAVNSTILRAIHRKHFSSWPGMTTKLMRKHLPPRLATTQGHLDQEFKNMRTTQVRSADEEITPGQEPDNIKTNDVMCSITTLKDVAKEYSDQTGKFPITSSRSHKYIFVFYHYDTHAIIGIPIKSRNTTDICAAWLQAFEICKAQGETPDIHILDNECSKDMKDMFQEKGIAFQLVPHIFTDAMRQNVQYAPTRII